MDEPTMSSLTESETVYLFRIIKELREAGVAILYPLHRLDEMAAHSRSSDDLARWPSYFDGRLRFTVGQRYRGAHGNGRSCSTTHIRHGSQSRRLKSLLQRPVFAQ